MKTKTLLLLVSILIGAGLGVLFPGQAEASVTIYIWNHPGPSGTTGTLTCTWHSDSGCPSSPGYALDWANSRDAPVYWRSFGYRDDIANGETARGTIRVANTACRRVRVDMEDIFGFPKGWIRYSHSYTWTPDWRFSIYAGYNAVWTKTEVARTAQETDPNCPWTTFHLHQRSGGWPWTDNTSLYRQTGSYPIENFGYHQSWQDWCWFC